MKYLVTGFPGCGKSTVAVELKKSGYNAISTDETDGLCRFVDSKTKQPVSIPKNMSAEQKTKLQWAWNIDKITNLLDRNPDIIICGISHNQNLVYDKFDKIIVLMIDETTMKQRLASRKTNQFGKHPKELKILLKGRASVQSGLLNLDKSAAINSANPLKKVVKQVEELIR